MALNRSLSCIVFFSLACFTASFFDYQVSEYIAYSGLFLTLLYTAIIMKQSRQVYSSPELAMEVSHSHYQRANHQTLSVKSLNEVYAALANNFKFAFLVVDEAGRVVQSNQMCSTLFSIAKITRIRQFNHISNDILALINEGKEQAKVCSIKANNVKSQALVQLVKLTMEEQEYRIVIVSDIHQFIEQRQHDSWEKVIKIIAHEVMNSLGPMISLAQSAQQSFENNEQSDEKSTAEIAIEVIKRRAEGLQVFVEGFRGLTQLPEPKIDAVDVYQLVDELAKNRPHEIEVIQERNVKSTIVQTDASMLEQVLINLIKNAEDATQEVENPQIKLVIYRPSLKQLNIDVIDNGIGIRPDVIDNLFIPFYTSKKEGSGIGLALSKQMCYLLGVNLSVKSLLKEQTTFTLSFEYITY